MITYIAIAGTVASVVLGVVCLHLLRRVDSYITRLGDVEEALSYETARADRAEAAEEGDPAPTPQTVAVSVPGRCGIRSLRAGRLLARGASSTSPPDAASSREAHR